MANSSIIGKIKNKIIREFISDDTIVKAIDSHNPKVKEPEDLIYTHIFDFNQNPYTLQDVQTFITIQVHIPEDHSFNNVERKSYVHPTIEIWITSHENHMKVDNIPKITQNRNDYLSHLIDKKLNGADGYGIGKLQLLSNKEFSYESDYVCRTLVFSGTDLNNSLCIDEDDEDIEL